MFAEGEGRIIKEPFEPWWARNTAALAHLPSDLCEQWVHRHWEHSSFSGLPLDTLAWTRAKWDGTWLLGAIYRVFGGALNPEFDYGVFQRRGGDDRHQTALALDSGTWDYPMVLLNAPHGVIDNGAVHPEVRYVLIEGHQRHRYLNALHARGTPPSGPHEVIMLTSPLVSGPRP